jgi:hypothetical protein
VPRYFFNMVDGSSRNLLKDSDGAEFSDLNKARKEAVGLARDVARHGFQGSAIWQVVVTDESGREALTIPLSEIRAPRISAWLDLGRAIAHLEARFGTRAFVWLVLVAALTLIAFAALTPFRGREQSATYSTASAPTEGAVVAVRFVADAHAADITEFLETYRASLVGGPFESSSLLIPRSCLGQLELVSLAFLVCLLRYPADLVVVNFPAVA